MSVKQTTLITNGHRHNRGSNRLGSRFQKLRLWALSNGDIAASETQVNMVLNVHSEIYKFIHLYTLCYNDVTTTPLSACSVIVYLYPIPQTNHDCIIYHVRVTHARVYT